MVFITFWVSYILGMDIITLLKRYHRMEEKNICHLIITNHIEQKNPDTYFHGISVLFLIVFCKCNNNKSAGDAKSAALLEKYR